jgi:hypothetical protein
MTTITTSSGAWENPSEVQKLISDLRVAQSLREQAPAVQKTVRLTKKSLAALQEIFAAANKSRRWIVED